MLLLQEIKQWDFTLTNYDSVWKLLVQIGLVVIFLFLGNMIRNLIPFLKKSLIPSALIGGLLLLVVDIICKQFDFKLIDQQFMQVLTYHGLGIGFIAMSLKMNKKGKTSTIKSIENGVMTGGAYMLQAFLGLAITICLFLITKNASKPTFYASGLLLPLGFGQGPGNALTWDINFSNLENGTLFSGGGSVGLSIASIGFIVASLFGVIYINYYKRKGSIKVEEDRSSLNRNVLDFEEQNEIPDAESIDKFSVQIGLVAISYALAFGLMCGLGAISNFTNSIAWGFNFIWGVLTANLVKLLLNLLKKKNIIKRRYINNYQMDRISGFAFDVMIVAGVAAISIENVKDYIVPLIILCVVGAISTFIYVKVVCKHCFKGIEHEMFVTNFGTVTGTASNGMILLKEIDPNTKTPASSLFIVSQLPATICVAPLLLLLTFASSSFNNALIALAIFFALFVGYTIFLFRNKIFKKKCKKIE